MGGGYLARGLLCGVVLCVRVVVVCVCVYPCVVVALHYAVLCCVVFLMAVAFLSGCSCSELRCAGNPPGLA